MRMIRDALGLSALDYKRLTYIQKAKNLISNRFGFPIYFKTFGVRRAMALWKAKKSGRLKWLDECVNILEEDFAETIKKYKETDQTLKNMENERSDRIVWVCWLQGENQLPSVVQLCLDSIKQTIPDDSKIVLITSKNLKEYVQLPDYIYKKLRSGSLQINHFTDIVRFMLLKQYGGMWIDATVFVSDKIPKSYFDVPLYSIQSLSEAQRGENIYYGALTSFLIGGQAGNLLFSFCVDFFLEYQMRYNWLIDVHWINLAYTIAYRNFTTVRTQVDSIGVNNTNRSKLDSIANDVFEKNKWEALMQSQIFHKMNWRKSYRKSMNGKDTFYGYINQLYKKAN